MLHTIYKKLYSAYGKQGWWPFTLEQDLHPKHHGLSPRNDKEIFEIIVGAILTQNTSWINVEKAIFNLNKAKLLDKRKIIKTPAKKLAQLIRPSGYFNQKAERLKIVADFFVNNENPSRSELLAVKGIGPETADSILLYAFGKPYFVVDAYTKRIFSRMGMIEKNADYDSIQTLFMSKLPKRKKLYNEYHALIVEHAKQHCKTKPLCTDCPIRKQCNKNI